MPPTLAVALFALPLLRVKVLHEAELVLGSQARLV